MTPTSLSKLLQKEAPGFTGLEALKFYQRPYICPFHKILENIDKESSLFDIGFGSGLMLFLAAKTRQLKKIGGVEISPGMVEKSKTFLEKIDGIELNITSYDGKEIPDEISQYQYISMIDVYHHIPKNQQKEFLKQLYNKMAPGSKLMLKDMDADRKILVLFNKLHDLALVHEIGNEAGTKEMGDIIQSIGFKKLDYFTTRMLWYGHYYYLLEK
jgi:2-polyprenyl-3-methyl-5-hydroxy-6-metoxy-1,4-benzoquinol methylase